MARRSLGTAKKCLFSALTCLALFAGVEVAWRALHGWNWTWLDCHRYHPVLGWSLREGWQGRWEWTAGASCINPQGLRDDCPVLARQPDEQRLLILGDSVTFGARVRTEETYPHRLEVALAAAGRPWRVLNGGVTGYDPSQEADWLELFGLDLQPAALAIGFCDNDVFPSERAEWQTKYGANRVSQWLNEHSIACFGVQRGLQRLTTRLPRYLGFRAMTATYEEYIERSWPFVEEAYRRIAAHARARNLPVYLLVFPSRQDASGLTQHSLRRRLRAFCAEQGWHMIDLLEDFRGDADALFLPEDDLHLSPLGHQRTAQAVARQFTHGPRR